MNINPRIHCNRSFTMNWIFKKGEEINQNIKNSKPIFFLSIRTRFTKEYFSECSVSEFTRIINYNLVFYLWHKMEWKIKEKSFKSTEKFINTIKSNLNHNKKLCARLNLLFFIILLMNPFAFAFYRSFFLFSFPPRSCLMMKTIIIFEKKRKWVVVGEGGGFSADQVSE